jgi:hypothetical protein
MRNNCVVLSFTCSQTALIKSSNMPFILSTKNKEIYVSEADAYYELNKLVGMVNEVLWNDARKLEPFYTEMLLFSLADKGVFQEITERVRIEIK